MSIPTLQAYESKADAPYQTLQHTRDAVATGFSGTWFSMWRSTNGIPALLPTTPVVANKSTSGAIPFINSTSGQRLAKLSCRGNQPCSLVLVDRLSHMGSLSGTDTGTQTVNTAALSRYTSGVGVFAGVEIYTALGTSFQTYTVSYTNSAGVSGQTSLPMNIGGTTYREVGRFIPTHLALDDIGIRSIETLTLSGSTGTVGNFGITLFKPLLKISMVDTLPDQFEWDAIRHRGGHMPTIDNDACLAWMVLSCGTTTGVLNPILKLIEE